MPAPGSAVHAARAIIVIYREFEQATRLAAMNMGQYRTLLFLRSGPKRASEIAEAAVLKKPTVTGRLNGLRERNWVREEIDARDGRAIRIAITEEGLAEMKVFEQLLTERMAAIVPGHDLAGHLATMAELYHLLGLSKEARMLDIEEAWLG